MKRRAPRKEKSPQQYAPLVVRTLQEYRWMADELDIGMEPLQTAAAVGVRRGIADHRGNRACRRKESECVRNAVGHFVDLAVVKACLLASTDEDLAKAEHILMHLIEG